MADPRSATRPRPRPGQRRSSWLFTAVVVLLIALAGDSGRAAAAPRTQFGVDVPNADLTAFRALGEQLGVQPSLDSIFVKLDSTNTDILRAVPSGVTPFITLEPWSRASTWGNTGLPQYSLASIVAGDHDTALRAVAHVIAGLHRVVYLRFAHEMNGHWYPWAASVNGNSPAQYVAAWRHAVDVMRPILGTAARWVWSPNIVNGLPAGTPPLSQLYPGDAYVDAVGLTGYSHGTSVTATFCPTITALRAVSSKPVVLSEIGVEGSAKASWLAELGPFIAANPSIVAFVYFDTSPGTTGATGNYRIDQHDDAAALRSSLAYLGIGSKAPPATGSSSGSASLHCG